MLVLGIDAGASKTECLLSDGEGRILAKARGPGANFQLFAEDEVEFVLADAGELLAACEGSVARAVVAGSGSVTAAEAKRLLEKHGHRLRDVLEQEFATTVSRKQRVKRKGAKTGRLK